MAVEITDAEAVRRIVLEEACGDFVDVADRARERFGLRIGSGRVEQILKEMKEAAPEPPHSRIGRAGIALMNELPPRNATGAGPRLAVSESHPDEHGAAIPDGQQAVLQFVKAMGGFERARAAITELEQSLKHLMQTDS